VQSDREHDDVLGEEDDEDEAKHPEESGLDDFLVPVALLRPGRHGDG